MITCWDEDGHDDDVDVLDGFADDWIFMVDGCWMMMMDHVKKLSDDG